MSRYPSTLRTPPPPCRRRILAINGGSSSVKFALFAAGDPLRCLHRGAVDRIDLHTVPTDWLDSLALGGHLEGVMAVGHWVVHGGPKHSDPQPVTVDLLAERYIAEHGDDRPEIGGWRWPSPSPTTD